MASEDELAEMGIVTETPDGEKMQVQVLERGPNGEIVSYRKIFEEDVLTEIPISEGNRSIEDGAKE
ncbi:hypothetical protein EOL72_02985 [Candidatus Falkowbacteria bacterium]|nr:hypothetical protein [Candidatus Falkowbacteria bacterium]